MNQCIVRSDVLEFASVWLFLCITDILFVTVFTLSCLIVYKLATLVHKPIIR